MTIDLLPDGTIRLEGHCVIEDAETLHRHLLAHPQHIVDWTQCDSAHSAVIQVLMAAEAALRGPPRGDFLRKHVQPLIPVQPARHLPFKE